MNNKVCLSNFVSERFLKLLQRYCHTFAFFGTCNTFIRASGQSECVDKVAKSLWHFKQKKTHRMMTFLNHFFGNGTFLARSLNAKWRGAFSPWISCHNRKRMTITQTFWRQVRDTSCRRENHAGVWIEPITQMGNVNLRSREFLRSLKAIPLPREGRFRSFTMKPLQLDLGTSSSHYFRVVGSGVDCRMRDLLFWVGRQGLVFCRKGIWVADKLMMISTWDGDEFSFANYHRSMRRYS